MIFEELDVLVGGLELDLEIVCLCMCVFESCVYFLSTLYDAFCILRGSLGYLLGCLRIFVG